MCLVGKAWFQASVFLNSSRWKTEYPALIKMRKRTNQMVGINQPCSTWSQKVCKFELQKMHRWNICCVKFLGRTSSTTFKNSTSRNLTSLSSATSRNKYQAFVFEMCLRLEPLRNTNTCNKNLLQANLASTCFEIRWFLRLASDWETVMKPTEIPVVCSTTRLLQ